MGELGTPASLTVTPSLFISALGLQGSLGEAAAGAGLGLGSRLWVGRAGSGGACSRSPGVGVPRQTALGGLPLAL